MASPLDPPCRGVGACVGGDAGAGVTREYQAALLQLVRSSDQEIAQRKTSARRFYGIAAGEDEEEAAEWFDELAKLEENGAYFFCITPVLTEAVRVV